MHRSERLENCISHHFSIFPVLGAGSGGSERAGQGRRFCRVAAKAAAVPSLRSRGLQTRVRRADDHRCCFLGGFFTPYHPSTIIVAPLYHACTITVPLTTTLVPARGWYEAKASRPERVLLFFYLNLLSVPPLYHLYRPTPSP